MSGGPYLAMTQDDREASCDGLERGEGIRRFFHHVDGQLGGGIRSGLPVGLVFRCCS